MFRRQTLLIVLATSIIAPPARAPAQASAKPQVVLPPLHTIQPLEVGPPPGPKDEIELSPAPLDQEVEHPLLIEITIFQQEPAPEGEGHSTDPSNGRIYTRSVRIATDGILTGGGYSGSRYVGEFQGWGGGPPLSRDSLAQVKSLIAALPPDHGRIPPRNRKVQVEIATRHGTETRMYDAANLPEAVLEIFRLTDTNFTPVVPQFAPDLQASLSEQEPGRTAALLAVSHDRRLSVVFPWQLNLTDVTAWLAQDIACHHEHQPCPGDDWAPWPQVVDASGRIVFKVPSLLDSSSIQFRAAWFTPDDRYLVFSTSIRAILVYDARSWRPVAQIPAIPAGAIDFEPSPDWKRAMVTFPSGEIDLWDVVSGRRVSRMDFGAEPLPSIAWAPDSGEVAVYTPGHDPSTSHFGIWNAQTGRLEHEILSIEPVNWWVNGAPLWTPDGKYLLADTSGTIGIWNADSGRYRGSFTDAGAGNLILHFDEGHLIMDCEGGDPVVWDADSAIRAVAAFEASLSAEK